MGAREIKKVLIAIDYDKSAEVVAQAGYNMHCVALLEQ